ncbi:MAG: winged helix-turn-helix domain-containing protein, partial [Pyrinomonadaceae bacterium]
MAMSNEVNTLYEFANFRFDCIKHRLWRDDELVPLSPKASGLLKLLLERNGEFVPKEDIFADVWAGTFVEDGVLTQNIYVLRKILGKSPSGEQIIENKTRFGYRISVPINVVAATESENVEPSTPSDPPQQIEAPAPRSVGAWARPALIIGGIFLLALPLAFVAYQYFGPTLGSYFRGRQIAIKFTKLTDTGDLTGAVLSPDGKSIAFIRDGSIFLKDILTEKEIKLDIPGHTSVSSLRFSPDGNLLYFRNNKALSTQAAIVRTSRFGGDVETVIDRSWGSFSVSPDGKKIAYILNVPPIAKFNLKVRNLETGEEHDHFTTEQPENICLRCAPAWSPDGTKIVFTILVPPGNGRLIVLDLTSGKTDEIKFKKLRRFEQAAWLPDGSSFLLSASEGSRFFHIWKV